MEIARGEKTASERLRGAKSDRNWLSINPIQNTLTQRAIVQRVVVGRLLQGVRETEYIVVGIVESCVAKRQGDRL